jgi:hypothetical protein
MPKVKKERTPKSNSSGGSDDLREAAVAAAGGSTGRSKHIHNFVKPHVTAQVFVPIKTRAPTTCKETGEELIFKRVTNNNLFYGFIGENIMVDDCLISANDGIYTWIIKDIPDKGRHLFAGQPITAQEIGTLHNNLHAMSGRGTIVSAGELVKIGSTVQFNFLSGTYMAPIFDELTTAEKKRLRDKLITTSTEFMTSIGITASFNGDEDSIAGEPILEANPIITKESNLKRLKTFLNSEPKKGGRRTRRRSRRVQ